MQNRFLLALILSMVLMMAWSALYGPDEKPAEGDQQTTEESGDEAGTQTPEAGTPTESPESKPSVAVDGPVAPALDQIPEAAPFAGELAIQNDVLRVEFAQQGAVAETVWLLEHWEHVEDKGKAGYENKLRFIRSYEGGPRAFELIDDGVPESESGWLNTRSWATTGPAADGRSIEFTTEVLQSARKLRLSRSYSFHPSAPHRLLVKFGLQLVEGPAGGVEKNFWMNTSGGVYPEERSDGSNEYGLSFSHVQIGSREGDGVDLVSFSASDLLEEGTKGVVPDGVFGCDMGVYFGAYLRPISGGGRHSVRAMAVDPYAGTAIESPSREDLERLGPYRSYTQIAMQLAAENPGDESETIFDWYVGPKDHRSIKKEYSDDDVLREDYLDVADAELTAQGSFCCLNDYFGWLIQAISKAVVWMIAFFTGLFGSAGVAIIVLTICVRVLMFPITRKSQVAMQVHAKKMAKLKPKIEALKKKHDNDQQKVAAEQMKLMKSEGVSMLPLGGCLPMFLQIPVFFGLFSAIRFDYELRHAAFLWCKDLSMPDTVIAINPISLPCFCMPGGASISGLNVFPLLMIGAMFFHQLGMPKSPDPQMQQQQKMMMFMPLFFGVMMYGYAAGLSVYWLSSSLFGIFEQRVIKKLFPIDKDDAGSVPATS